jgi:septum formation protein
VADTTVALGRRILAKPADAAGRGDAARAVGPQPPRLHGRGRGPGAAHRPGPERFARPGGRADRGRIAAYVRSGEPFGKAGAYGIQGRFAAWVQRIEGSYTGIMGLPLFETAALLGGAGFTHNR